jgi:hypothetical protein
MNQKLGKRKRRRLQAKARAQSAAAANATPAHVRRFFHGGLAGLKVGGYILPPSETGVSPNGFMPPGVRRIDRIYVTTDPTVAIGWASFHPAPLLYEVEPEGEVINDPDHKGEGISFIPAHVIEKARTALRQRVGSCRNDRSGAQRYPRGD